jgi:hypothetical protein
LRRRPKVMNRIRLVGLAFMMVFAMSGVAATSASARSFEFRAETYPVEVKGRATSAQSFELAGLVVVCKNATFKGGEEGARHPAGPQETLEIHPRYSECEMTPGGVFKAKVNTTGCNYVFHVAEPRSKNGSADVTCQVGKSIEVVDEGVPGCVIEVPPQTGLKPVEYVNEQPKVKVNTEFSNITYRATSACGLVIKEGGDGGGYRGSAVFEGFKPGTAEADGLEVHPSHP